MSLTDPSTAEQTFAMRLRTWRRLNRIKQEWLANRLGVTQAAISRWEAGSDRPRRSHLGKLIDVIEDTLSGPLAIEKLFVTGQQGISSLVNYDGMRLLAVSKGFKATWPEFAQLTGRPMADALVEEALTLHNHPDYRNGAENGAIAMVSGVSHRHTSFELDDAVRHRWHACFRRHGPLLLMQVVYEPCDVTLPTGIDLVMNLDTFGDRL